MMFSGLLLYNARNLKNIKSLKQVSKTISFLWSSVHPISFLFSVILHHLRRLKGGEENDE